METKKNTLKHLLAEVHETPICHTPYIKVYRVVGWTREHYKLINTYLNKEDAEKDKEYRMNNDPSQEYTDVRILSEIVFLRF